MDDRRFDNLARGISTVATRRAALVATTATLLGVTRSGSLAKGKKHRNKRCLNSDKFCAQDGSGKPCCSGLCCPPWVFVGQTKYACAPAGEVSGCCTEAQGGGYCAGFPLCCGNPLRERETTCELEGGECCTDKYGGSCDPGFTCCDDAAFGYCCPKVSRAGDGSGASEASRRKSRNFRYRDDLIRG